METKSVMIVGVGGQGSLLASRILGNVLLQQGFSVKVSEVHGMSQRGGSVVTYVRYGEKVASPIIEKGCADTVLAFELLEAKRAVPYLKEGGKIIVNAQQMDPMPVILGTAKYPEDIDEVLNANAEVIKLDAAKLALEAGNLKAVNVVLIGVLAKSSNIAYDVWVNTIKSTVPEKFLEVNLKAFDLGYNFA